MSALGPRAGARIAVVGAGGGIGRALVGALVEAGCEVAALDLAGPLEALEGAAERHALDVADAGAVATAFAALGAGGKGLDGLVNLAGFTAPRSPAEETDEAVWDEVVAANLRGAWLVARAGLPLLRQCPGSSLVNTATGLAFRAAPGYAPYSAAKAGVVALTRTLALEAAPGVRVNAVAPGAVQTPFLTGGTGRAENDGLRFDVAAYAASVPLARIAEPADVVGPILFLLGPGSRYMTGQVRLVNGGLYMG